MADFIFLQKNYPAVKNVTYIAVDDGTPAFLMPRVTKIGTQYGINVGNMVTWGLDTVDFSPIAQKAAATKPDGILLGNGPGLPLLQALRAAGYTGVVFSSGGSDPQSYLAATNKTAATNFFGPGMDQNIADAPAFTKEIANRIVSESPEKELNLWRLQFFNSLYTMCEMIQKAQSFDPQVVSTYLNSMGPNDTLDSAQGPVMLTGQTLYGFKHVFVGSIPMMTMDNGVLKNAGWITLPPG